VSSREGHSVTLRPSGRSHTIEDESAQLAQLREKLRLFAARRLGDWAAAEDVAQEALRRTLEAQRAGRIANPGSVSAFLFQTTVHICQHRVRAAMREVRALRRFASNGPIGASESENPLQSLISSERQAEVRRAMDKLGPEDREILTLTYSEALSASEIGGRLGLSEGNVRVRRHRALLKLAEFLGVTERFDRGLKG
jgi:RNA polymerase sigma-70 factor (ECF subfamily)